MAPPASGPPLELHLEETPAPPRRCPADMLEVRGAYCIDRYEVTLVDAQTSRELSPYYHPTSSKTSYVYRHYRDNPEIRSGYPSLLPDVKALSLPPPLLALEREPEPMARSVANVIPQGYLSSVVAGAACRAAGKRLCTLDEWVTACRGERARKYPYGDTYIQGQCNVFRETHPAVALHGNASRNHLDPRLNLVRDADGPLLRRTGESRSCRSEWGDDAAFDMVGNVDEWGADGSFVGGFYARATREGCDSRVSSHSPKYFDYSLGTRCCRNF